MWFWPLLLGTVLAGPLDEFQDIVSDGEFKQRNVNLMQIVPGRFSIDRLQKKIDLAPIPEISDTTNTYYITFRGYVKMGFTSKGLTFNIYDDNMRDAAVALFRLLQNVNNDDLPTIITWAQEHVNDDILLYATRLRDLYKSGVEDNNFIPPYITKPNYFVNSETIVKALQISSGNLHDLSEQEKRVNQYYDAGDSIAINTNYSGWNLPQNGIDQEINYFREDVSLNSYYYGMHLMHPFWMSNSELDEVNPRHAEHYYYVHQQLMARYLLEKEHLKDRNVSRTETNYNPYLMYENGLPFPVRSSIQGDWNDNKAKIKAIDIAIKECISRGLLIMDNGTAISMSEDVGLLAKLIRANLDGIKTAKIVRSLFGYGGNGYPADEYCPAPSLLHHPETSLRDPVYWYMIQYILNYFNEYKNTLEPYDLSQYETDDFVITGNKFTKITTYFDYFRFSINKALKNSRLKWPLTVSSRQRRLRHVPFTFKFNVESKFNKDVIVRLFIGPECEDCWQMFSKFFELDSFVVNLDSGSNEIHWSPDSSSKFSYDDFYNMDASEADRDKFNYFKFPESLLIPKGLSEGLNLTLFIIVTPADDLSRVDHSREVPYRQFCHEVDRQPLGFPFHRQASNYKNFSSNYKFYNITIYHTRNKVAYGPGYFSPNLH